MYKLQDAGQISLVLIYNCIRVIASGVVRVYDGELVRKSFI